VVVNFGRVDRVTVAARAGMDTDIFAFVRREVVKDPMMLSVPIDTRVRNDALIVQVHECLQQICPCPWVSRIVLGGETP
jgi:hypothetical protein